ncbi:hypothetical protein MACH09_42650 [Vibrio sp. MACH09]|nr:MULTISPECIES: hypothetical protein [unclassified Vibrio]GLO63757.1 hypothetical protein MACH09_42650 [Vibrio sp. MACH09]
MKNNIANAYIGIRSAKNFSKKEKKETSNLISALLIRNAVYCH